jgi:aspartate aminotransferase
MAEFALRHRLVVIADEVYGELVYDDAEFVSFASLGPQVRDRTVTVGGFSKSFAMAGWRIGFAAAPEPVASALQAWQGHTTSAASTVSQHAALAVLCDESWAQLADQRAELDRRRRQLCRAVAALPRVRLALRPRGTFFAFVDISDVAEADGRQDAATMFAETLLRETAVAVMPGTDFGAPTTSACPSGSRRLTSRRRSADYSVI